MVLSLLVPPAAPPVTLADAKAHLRVTHDGEDGLITDLIATAASFMAEDVGLALVNQDWRVALSSSVNAPVNLPRHPVIRIVSVTVYDRDGNQTMLDGARYTLDPMQRPARLTFDSGAIPNDANGVDIDFEAGFGTSGADVPDTLRRAAMALVAHWYEFRSVYAPCDQPVSLPIIYTRLTRNWRRIGI